MTTWADLREYITARYPVDRDMGAGFILRVKGPVREHSVLVGVNRPEFGSESYLSAEIAVGRLSDTDLVTVLQAGSNLLGGAACFEETVSLRDSRCLDTLTPQQFDIMLSYLSGAIDGYHMTRNG